MTTDIVSKTNSPPAIAKTISCFTIKEIDPNVAPNANDPVSPINTLAGGALNHKKPSADPIKAPHKTDNSPVPGI